MKLSKLYQTNKMKTERVEVSFKSEELETMMKSLKKMLDSLNITYKLNPYEC